MTVADARRLLAERVSPRLVEHCEAVSAYAVELAARWGADQHDALLAGLLHDSCRELEAGEALHRARLYKLAVSPMEERRPVELLHARLAAAELSGSGLSKACLQAMARHTVGGPGMSLLDKCVYVADGAAAGRDYEGVDRIRALAACSLDAAVQESVRGQLTFLLRRRLPIHPDTVALYNEVLG